MPTERERRAGRGYSVSIQLTCGLTCQGLGLVSRWTVALSLKRTFDRVIKVDIAIAIEIQRVDFGLTPGIDSVEVSEG